ncbi:MAG: hypothetical protein GQ581_00785 [Methyloprofundus sp.]|nr:hypothetical protein [Methyloprofundus sp.]
MNENNQQDDGADKASIDQKVSAKRRLFVKGAAGAVPAVLTLRSGAAFALSSAEMCNIKDNGVAGAGLSVITEDNTDPWLRKELVCRELDINGDGSSIVTVYPDPFIADKWRAEDYNSSIPPSGDIYVDTPFTLPDLDPVTMNIDGDTSSTYSYAAVTRFVLVVMNDSGTAVDLGAANSNGNSGLPYITTSCWTSAAPTASGGGTGNITF